MAFVEGGVGVEVDEAELEVGVLVDDVFDAAFDAVSDGGEGGEEECELGEASEEAEEADPGDARGDDSDLQDLGALAFVDFGGAFHEWGVGDLPVGLPGWLGRDLKLFLIIRQCGKHFAGKNRDAGVDEAKWR